MLADVGAKSPVSCASRQGMCPRIRSKPVPPRSVSRRFDWSSSGWADHSGRPALILSLTPEAASFSRPVFYSTRAADPALRPRLRISYLLSFPFETP